MRLAFMGTPDFAVPSLAELIASGHEIVAVYSQPPRPKGRGQKLTPSPVHAFAEAMGLPVFTPESMKAAEAIDTFKGLDLDAACVVAYGQILKPEVLDEEPDGAFSILPTWWRLQAQGRLFGVVMDAFWLHVGDPAARDEAEALLSR